MSSILGPAALARLDDALVERIRAGRDLRGVVLGALSAIVLGGGTYGLVFGLWRAPEQALYTAIKLPLLLLLLTVCTVGLSAMLAALLRSKLTVAQTGVAILLSLAVASVLLGALAPVSLLFVWSAPAPDPLALGLAIDDPRAAPSMEVARQLLLFHVVVIACAGITGLARLRGLLARLVPDRVIARRVLVSWLSLQFLVGSELSWLFRPFFGKPHLPPSLFRDEALAGNFFEEVSGLTTSAFGAAAPVVSTIAILSLVTGLVWALRAQRRLFSAAASDVGLVLAEGRILRWSELLAITQAGATLHIELAPDESLSREVVQVRCTGVDAARELAERIERERSSLAGGPFRT